MSLVRDEMRSVWFMDVAHSVRFYLPNDMYGRTWCDEEFAEWKRGVPPHAGVWMAGFGDEPVSCLWCVTNATRAT